MSDRRRSEVTLVIPMLNEETALPAVIANIATLDPQPAEVVAVDGGSTDRSVEIAREAGFRVIDHHRKGRATQLNRGVEEAHAALICVLHADTELPSDALALVEDTLANPRRALGGFTPLLTGTKTRWGTSFHNWAKTYYGPILLRPHLFVRGLRLLFGDHAMFFRRADFLSVGGCDPDMNIMEDVDLCLRLCRLGSVKLVPRIVKTSDRRIAEWGPLKANWIYMKCGMSWAFGRKYGLDRHYPDIR
ncbi:glycosyltransferase [Parasphingopyxis sp. CP4]|uniref:glycosyltransferase n=1 Tax=Parasphingopyxis sp. CP4 TaxID=2724527 RepID=UPI0015A2DE27|nr:glycosyltransferase [Parasphingopyxis sp. CP4]QLC22164.1 glycosyltransferase [Parasphingopyxis sp. CP4]